MARAIFTVAALASAHASANAMEMAAATKFVDGLNTTTFAVLQSKELSPDQKESKVRALLSDNFDLNLIGKYVLGSSWRKATSDQRNEYLPLFRKYILSTYSRKLLGYSGQKLKFINAKSIGKNDVLVMTNMARPNGPPLAAGWRVRSKQGEHHILDVVVAGVSMVLTQRSEFSSVVRRQGINGLIARLRTHVTKSGRDQ